MTDGELIDFIRHCETKLRPGERVLLIVLTDGKEADEISFIASPGLDVEAVAAHVALAPKRDLGVAPGQPVLSLVPR